MIKLFHDYGIMEKSDVIDALGALAQESRLDVFRLLVQTGEEGLQPSQIGERLGVPANTLSFHLKELKHAGLVTFRREGRALFYVAEYDAMNALLAYLTENCCQGEAGGCAVQICDTTPLVKPKARSTHQ